MQDEVAYGLHNGLLKDYYIKGYLRAYKGAT
jgi:hypothetical protein